MKLLSRKKLICIILTTKPWHDSCISQTSITSFLPARIGKTMEKSIDKKELKRIDGSIGIGSSRYSFKDKESAHEFISQYNQAIKAGNSRLTGSALFENVIKPNLINLLGSRYVNTLPLGIQIDAAVYGALLWTSKEKQYFTNKKDGIRKSWEKHALSSGEKDLINLNSRLRVNNEDATMYMQDMLIAYKSFRPEMVIENGIKMVDCIIGAIRYSEALKGFGYNCEINWDIWGLSNEDVQIAFNEIALCSSNGKIRSKDDLWELVLVYLGY